MMLPALGTFAPHEELELELRPNQGFRPERELGQPEGVMLSETWTNQVLTDEQVGSWELANFSECRTVRPAGGQVSDIPSLRSHRLSPSPLPRLRLI